MLPLAGSPDRGFLRHLPVAVGMVCRVDRKGDRPRAIDRIRRIDRPKPAGYSAGWIVNALQGRRSQNRIRIRRNSLRAKRVILIVRIPIHPKFVFKQLQAPLDLHLRRAGACDSRNLRRNMKRCILRIDLKRITNDIEKRLILIPVRISLSGYRNRAEVCIDTFLQCRFCRVRYTSPILLRLRSRQPINDLRTGIACPGKGYRSVLAQIRGFRPQRQLRSICCSPICPNNHCV